MSKVRAVFMGGADIFLEAKSLPPLR